MKKKSGWRTHLSNMGKKRWAQRRAKLIAEHGFEYLAQFRQRMNEIKKAAQCPDCRDWGGRHLLEDGRVFHPVKKVYCDVPQDHALRPLVARRMKQKARDREWGREQAEKDSKTWRAKVPNQVRIPGDCPCGCDFGNHVKNKATGFAVCNYCCFRPGYTGFCNWKP